MTSKFLSVFFSFLIISLIVSGQSEQLVINISPLEEQGILTFENPKGSIKVTGYDGDVIVVTGTMRHQESEKQTASGMRKLDQNLIDLTAEVNGNIVILQSSSLGRTIDFDIKVPKQFSLNLKSLDNGSIEIININGEIEVENTNGDITLDGISGSAVLSTVYGKISANFREVNPSSPMMFSSFEGEISITLPASVKAKLKMRSEKGEILSDFEIDQTGRQPVVKNLGDKQVYSLENWIVGTVNSGGPEYIISSYTGNIILRKK